MVSLDAEVSDETDSCLVDLLPDPRGNFTEAIESRMTVETILESSRLKDREKEILRDWAGGETQSDIAKRLGLSRERTRQIVAKSLKKCRQNCRNWL